MVVGDGSGAGRRALGGRRRAGRGLSRLFRSEEVLVQSLDDVGHVEERVALLADVDEGGLHPREDPGHLPLKEVSDDPAVRFPLDEELGDDAVVQERHLRLLGGAAHDEILGHGRSLP